MLFKTQKELYKKLKKFLMIKGHSILVYWAKKRTLLILMSLKEHLISTEFEFKMI